MYEYRVPVVSHYPFFTFFISCSSRLDSPSRWLSKWVIKVNVHSVLGWVEISLVFPIVLTCDVFITAVVRDVRKLERRNGRYHNQNNIRTEGVLKSSGIVLFGWRVYVVFLCKSRFQDSKLTRFSVWKKTWLVTPFPPPYVS